MPHPAATAARAATPRQAALAILRHNLGFAEPERWVDYALGHSFTRVRASAVPDCPGCGAPPGRRLGQYVHYSTLIQLLECHACGPRLDLEAAIREADFRERIRRLDLDLRQAQARLAALRTTSRLNGAGLVVLSPCDGSLLRLHTRAIGAFVESGDLLADVACTSDSLVVELEIPASGIGRVRPGQDVRLLYDAFPYERFGIRYAELTWVGASAPTYRLGDSTGFRARARPEDRTIRAAGVDRALEPGMGGLARVVVERRRLIAYAFAPLMQLREAMAGRR
jgi:hypothetical protein